MSTWVIGIIVAVLYVVYLGVLRGDDAHDWLQRRGISDQFKKFLAGLVAVVSLIAVLLLVGLAWAPVEHFAQLAIRLALAWVAIVVIAFVGKLVFDGVMRLLRTRA